MAADRNNSMTGCDLIDFMNSLTDEQREAPVKMLVTTEDGVILSANIDSAAVRYINGDWCILLGEAR